MSLIVNAALHKKLNLIINKISFHNHIIILHDHRESLKAQNKIKLTFRNVNTYFVCHVCQLLSSY